MSKKIAFSLFASMIFAFSHTALAQPQPLKPGSVLVFENHLVDSEKPPIPSGEFVEFKINEVSTDFLKIQVPAIKGINFGKPITFPEGVATYSLTPTSQWLVKNKSTDGVEKFLRPDLKVGDTWTGPHPSHGSKLDWKVDSEIPFDLQGTTIKALKIVGSGRWFGGGSSGKLTIEYLYSADRQLLLGIHDNYAHGSGFGSTRAFKIVLKEVKNP